MTSASRRRPLILRSRETAAEKNGGGSAPPTANRLLCPRVFGDKTTVAGDSTALLGIDGGALDLSWLNDHELDLLEQLVEARIAALGAAAGKDSG